MIQTNPIRFYVSTEGQDDWSGCLAAPNANRTDGPFATLTRARNVIRQLKRDQGLLNPIEVQLRGGTYYLDQPFRLSAGDSGTPFCPITYMAYPGEVPVLSGGQRISNWQPFRDKIVCSHLPEVQSGLWWFRELFGDNKRLIRARWPNRDHGDPLYGGWAFIESVIADGDTADAAGQSDAQKAFPSAFRYEEQVFPHRWARTDQAEIFVIPGLCWISDIIPVKSVDYTNRTIHLTRPVGPSSISLGDATNLKPGNRFFVENNLEDLTEPGEWCLDARNGILYFWPPDGDVSAIEIIAPRTTRLIQMIGSAAFPLSHVTIQGLTFRHTQADWPTPESYYKTPNAGQTIYLENTAECAIEDNFFDAVGGDAIRLQNINRLNRITGNIIAEAGANGIYIGSFQRGFAAHDTQSGDLPSPTEWHANTEDIDVSVQAWPRSDGHLIVNNHIHHVGKLEKHAHGIAFFGVAVKDTVVAHNLIHDTPRFGIGLMSGLGRVIIEYNDLYNLSQETADTGGICSNRWYTYDRNPDLAKGCIIRFNRVRDVVGCAATGKKNEPGGKERANGKIFAPYYSWAIYFDNAPMDTLVYGNICARNTIGGIMISHYGKNVTVENNIFVDSDKFQAYLLFAGQMSNIRFRRNIFAYTNPDADFMRLHLDPKLDLPTVLSEFDWNLFSPPLETKIKFCGLPGEAVQRIGAASSDSADLTFEDWQKAGFDRNSIITDPKFVDPSKDNYDLQADSPVWQLGFQPIDTSQIGLLK